MKGSTRRMWVPLPMLGICSILLVIACAAKETEVPITTASDEALAAFMQARDLSERLRNQEAIQHYERAISEDAEFARAYFNLAFAYIGTGNPKGFWDNFRKAVALVDKVSEGERLLILAAKAGVDDNPIEQKRLLLQLVEAYPEDKRVQYALGLYYFGQRDFAGAAEQCKKALELAPDYAPPYNELGYAYSRLGKYAEAEAAFRKYAELIPEEPNPYDSLAELLMKQGKFDESIRAYEKALSVNPSFFASYVGIGTNLIFRGDPDSARAQFQKLYSIAPTNAQRRLALFWTAVSYVHEGRFDEALEELQKNYAIAEKDEDLPAMAGVVGTMGDLHLEAGRFEEARANYLKAVELLEKSEVSQGVKDESKQTLLFNEARVALREEDVEAAQAKAQEYCAQAEAGHDPLEMEICHQLAGMIALHEQRFDDALAELQQANPRNPGNLRRMAKAYDGKGDEENAKAMWAKAADFNEINYNYAFVRSEAKAKLSEM